MAEPVWQVLLEMSQALERIDAEVLLAHHLGVPRLEMLNDVGRIVPDDTASKLPILIARRLRGEPVAYITGHKEFWSLDLLVTPAVLIPRPDSETLIEAAIAHFGDGPGPRSIIDLGTGSGALLLAALDQWPLAFGIGVDANQTILDVARANAARLGFEPRAAFSATGWGGSGTAHDLVLCNPPYVATTETLPVDVLKYEPHRALFAGSDGLDDYRKLALVLGPQIAPGGVGCIEIGSTQADAVTALFAAAGLTVALRRDLAGLPRALIVTK
jgi:release factor glutamine methyltransferase